LDGMDNVIGDMLELGFVVTTKVQIGVSEDAPLFSSTMMWAVSAFTRQQGSEMVW